MDAASTRDEPLAPVLLFDLGRVLLDIDFQRCFRHWARAAGTDPDRLRGAFRVDAPFEAHERGELACEDYFAHLADALDLPLPVATLRAGWNSIFGPELPGLAERLRRLADHRPLHALSNTNASHTDVWRTRHADLLRPLGTLFLSHELGLRKPDPQIYREVARRLGRAPSEVLFLDDAPANLAGAAAAGMQVCHVPDIERVPALLDGWLERLETA